MFLYPKPAWKIFWIHLLFSIFIAMTLFWIAVICHLDTAPSPSSFLLKVWAIDHTISITWELNRKADLRPPHQKLHFSKISRVPICSWILKSNVPSCSIRFHFCPLPIHSLPAARAALLLFNLHFLDLLKEILLDPKPTKYFSIWFPKSFIVCLSHLDLWSIWNLF